MRTITQNIYQFSELQPKVQEKVLIDNDDILIIQDWWVDTITEDARSTAKLNITGFEVYRNIEAEFTSNAKSSALSVISEHGESCTTYSIAKKFLSDLEQLERKEDTAQTEADIEELEEKYLKAISKEYLNILEREYEDMQSDEALIDHFDNNNWEFYEDGRRFKS
jgi:hypothetical protein